MTGMQMAAFASGDVFGVVTINDQNPSDDVLDPANATAVFSLVNDATVISTGEVVANWLSIPANTGLFEARMTIISGAFTTGPAAGTWWPLSTTRTWTSTQPVVGDNIVQATLEIRLASSGVVQDSATITITATVS